MSSSVCRDINNNNNKKKKTRMHQDENNTSCCTTSEQSTATCSACQHHHHNHPTIPEFATRELRDSSVQETTASSLVPYGLLFGTLLFGFGALVTGGHSVARGMFEGAMTGVIAGVMADSALSSSPRRSPVRHVANNRTARQSPQCCRYHRQSSQNAPRLQEQQQQAQPQRQQQQKQQGVHQQQAQRRQGSPRALPGSSIARASGESRMSSNGYNPLTELMIWLFSALGGAHVDTRTLSYEQILQRDTPAGASDDMIDALPSTTIQNAEKELPAHLRECSVCLEEFKKGDKRKILPCLHGFHEGCINKWLHQNDSCPICKQKVSCGR